MPGMLGRSRSLRMLKGGFKQTHKQENDRSMPSTPLPGDAQIDLERINAATSASRPNERFEAPDIPQRPRTSGGPGDRGKQFHKKTTPAGAQLTPENPYPPAFPAPSSAKSTTVLYTAEVTQDREGVIDIGIALGSPGMAQHWDNIPRMTDSIASIPRTVTHISSNNDSHYTLPQAAEPHVEIPKPKLSRWKSLFKKTAPPPRPEKASFYQLAQSVTPNRADSHHENEMVDPRTASLKDDDDVSRSVTPPAFKPEIRESRKVPKGTMEPFPEAKAKRLTVGVNPLVAKAPLMRSASSPKPFVKEAQHSSPSVPKVIFPNGPQRPQDEWPRPPGTPLLDVNIPDVKMERYSVMFSGLLQPNSNQSSSLLARRQGNSEKVKPLHDLSIERENRGGRALPVPQRRATSPVPSKSPSGHLSLFPPANAARVPSPRSMSVNRPRPVQRSRTEPTRSPHEQDFPRSAEIGAPRAKISSNKRSDSASVESQPSPTSDRSFDSDSESITIVVARSAPGHNKPWKHHFDEREPEWEIVNKPTAAAPVPRSAQLSSPSPGPSPALMPAPLAPARHQHKPQIHVVTKQSALSSHPSSAPLDGPSANKPKAQLSPPMSADRAVEIQKSGSRSENGQSQATVGVARSVSVSRANKPELLRSATLTRRGMETSPTERLVENKALTPTLVEIGNRKSQRVQLVDA